MFLLLAAILLKLFTIDKTYLQIVHAQQRLSRLRYVDRMRKILREKATENLCPQGDFKKRKTS